MRREQQKEQQTNKQEKEKYLIPHKNKQHFYFSL